MFPVHKTEFMSFGKYHRIFFSFLLSHSNGIALLNRWSCIDHGKWVENSNMKLYAWNGMGENYSTFCVLIFTQAYRGRSEIRCGNSNCAEQIFSIRCSFVRNHLPLVQCKSSDEIISDRNNSSFKLFWLFGHNLHSYHIYLSQAPMVMMISM